MVINKEVLSDLKERFEKAQKVLLQESKAADPETSSHQFENASQILEGAKNDVAKALETVENNSEDYLTYEVIKGYIYGQLGKIDSVLGKSESATAYLNSCLETLRDRTLDPNAIIHCVAAKTELGLVLSNNKNNIEARQHLEEAETLYKNFKLTGEIAVSVFEVLSYVDDIEKREGRVELGKLYTLIAFYLAQVLSNLDETEKSAAYCHITLKRRHEADDYGPIDWALNAATLSQYYLTPNRFTEARHHLAAATYVMLEYEKKMLTPDMTHDEEQAAQETFYHRFADIARCWTKYGLALLNASRDRLLAEEDPPKTPEKSGNWEFTSLKLPPYEVTDKFCLTFDDAKPVYQFIMKQIERSKQYYTAELEATEYAKIIFDEADLYKVLAFFEDDPQVQCKYFKKQADLLEHILSLLNPTFYLAICREAWYNVALVYSNIMDTKLDILKANEDPTPHQRKKINTLTEKAITHLQSLLNSYKNKTNIPEDEMHIYLSTHFYIGRLFYKVLTPDRKQQLQNLRNCYRYYDQFVTQCKENKEAGERLKAEVGVCKEMLTLLPMKIESIIKEVEGSANH